MDSLEPRFDRALTYLSHGQIDEGIELLLELLGEDPDESVYHALLADCLLGQKRLIAAEYEINVAQSLDPSDPYVYLVRSRLQLLQRKFDLALESTGQALQLDPEYVEALLLEAQLLQLKEQPDEALKKLNQAAALAPSDTDVIVALGDYYLARGDAKKALELARDAMRSDAGSDDANVLMGQAYLAMGESGEADMHARYAISQNPHNSSALRLLVNVRMSENWFVGLWWRFNNSIQHLTSSQQGLVLILAFLFFQLAAQISRDLGFKVLGDVISYTWILVAVYSWVALPIYQRALQKMLSEFRFNPKF